MISWHQKTPDLYRARIAGILVEAQRVDGEWWAVAGINDRKARARGPIRGGLEEAMDAAAKMAHDLATIKA